jgi:hypothetical protein
MARTSAHSLALDYFVIKCKTPSGPIGLGIFGTVKLTKNFGLLFFAGRPPRKIRGLDALSMKMVAAVPGAIRQDVKELHELTPEKMLGEVARRYRGTIFAASRNSTKIPHTSQIAASPDKLMPKIIEAIVRAAKKEKLVHWNDKKKKPRRASAKARRATTSRRYDFPNVDIMQREMHV